MSYGSTTISEIGIDLLHPHPRNPRHDIGDVSELAASIKANGLISPLTVNPKTSDPDDGYLIIAGHRRYAACRKAGLRAVPCMIVNLNPREQVEAMLTENCQRNQLDTIEEAEAIQGLLAMGGTIDTIATALGRSRTYVTDRHRIMRDIPADLRSNMLHWQPTLKQMLQISEFNDDPDVQHTLIEAGANNISDFNWSYRRASERRQQRKDTARIEQMCETHGITVEHSQDRPDLTGLAYQETTPADDLEQALEDAKKALAEQGRGDMRPTIVIRNARADIYLPKSQDEINQTEAERQDRERKLEQQRHEREAWDTFNTRAQESRIDWLHTNLHRMKAKTKTNLLANLTITTYDLNNYSTIDNDINTNLTRITGIPLDQPLEIISDRETRQLRMTMLKARAEHNPLDWALNLLLATIEQRIGNNPWLWKYSTSNTVDQLITEYYTALKQAGYQPSTPENLALANNYEPLKQEETE